MNRFSNITISLRLANGSDASALRHRIIEIMSVFLNPILRHLLSYSSGMIWSVKLVALRVRPVVPLLAQNRTSTMISMKRLKVLSICPKILITILRSQKGNKTNKRFVITICRPLWYHLSLSWGSVMKVKTQSKSIFRRFYWFDGKVFAIILYMFLIYICFVMIFVTFIMFLTIFYLIYVCFDLKFKLMSIYWLICYYFCAFLLISNFIWNIFKTFVYFLLFLYDYMIIDSIIGLILWNVFVFQWIVCSFLRTNKNVLILNCF